MEKRTQPKHHRRQTSPSHWKWKTLVPLTYGTFISPLETQQSQSENSNPLQPWGATTSKL
jgi:hypothetical protein